MNFSVIIPHKNCTKLLQRCLDSIPDRMDLETIIIDDDSNLTLEEREKFPGINRPRTRVFFTKKGGGAGYARNVGMKYATGKYLLFLDADDFFSEKIEDVLDSVIGQDADIIFFKLKSVSSEDVLKPMSRCDYLNSFVDEYLNNCDKSADDFYIRCKWCVPVAKLIKKDLVDENGIKFSEVKYANDIFFSTKVGILAKKISAIRLDGYVVTVREKSLTSDFCGTSFEFRTRFSEALKADCFIKKSGIKRPENNKGEANELLWCVYYDRGERYLWKCCFDSLYNPIVFGYLFLFLFRLKKNKLWKKIKLRFRCRD